MSFLVACEPKPIKIGVSVTLTGLSSRIGVTGRNGIELAAEEINASGGIKSRKIELLVRDDKDLPEGALAADEELVAEGVVAIIGHMSSRSGIKAIPFCNSKAVVVVSPTISSTDWSGLDDFFFRPIGPNNLQGKTLAVKALSRGLKKAAVVYESTNSAYTLNVAQSFSEAFTAGGGVAAEPIPFATSKDYRYDLLAKSIAAGDWDMILSAAGPYDNARISQELAKLRSSLPVYAGMWSMTDDLIRNGGKTVERMTIAGTMDIHDKLPVFVDFRSAYAKRYGEDPTFASMFGYESIILLATALKDAKKLDSEGIKSAILARDSFPGLQGRIELDRFGDCTRPYRAFTVRETSFVLDE